ncbi:hypothetical protein PR048_023501 [Dryococelus australis]|uniref:DDE-1 domain-containing protein n=1 Tax=Dryococelus australis TaxID=614101 RepID=A0ABQ9GU83_9NEOP|nr:hypothetical protein PR048_023501 [Dryococelus australis]
MNFGTTDLVIHRVCCMTCHLQVIDVVVNKQFKEHLRQQYSEWLLAGDHALTPTGKIKKKPSVAQLPVWISTAWNRISPHSIIRGFKKGCVSNAMNNIEDNLCWKKRDDYSDGSDSSDGGMTDSGTDSD